MKECCICLNFRHHISNKSVFFSKGLEKKTWELYILQQMSIRIPKFFLMTIILFLTACHSHRECPRCQIGGKDGDPESRLPREEDREQREDQKPGEIPATPEEWRGVPPEVTPVPMPENEQQGEIPATGGGRRFPPMGISGRVLPVGPGERRRIPPVGPGEQREIPPVGPGEQREIPQWVQVNREKFPQWVWLEEDTDHRGSRS